MILSALEYVPLTAPHAPQDIEETQFVCDYIAGKHTRDEFFATFHPNAMSKGFNPDEDLQSIGIANQTTMLKVAAPSHAGDRSVDMQQSPHLEGQAPCWVRWACR